MNINLQILIKILNKVEFYIFLKVFKLYFLSVIGLYHFS